MKRFALVALLAAMLFGIASSVSATELKVKGNFDVYGLWSSNLRDFDSDTRDGDNYMTSQRWRTYFSYIANENLKAVIGFEANVNWGQGTGGDWGSDGTDYLRIKHAYLDFNFPDTKINVKVGQQAIALPSLFGNPVFDDDASAIVVSAPINDMFGLTVGYSRGADGNDNYDTSTGSQDDDLDMAFIAAPITLDGFKATPYFAYAWVGDNVGFGYTTLGINAGGSDIWVAGVNAELSMFDPFTIAGDLIYGKADLNNSDLESKGWYADLAASYKFDFMTATLFGTYATGFKDDDNIGVLPTLSEGWALTPYLGGARAFSTGLSDGFASDTLGVGSDGTALWTVGVSLDKISFVENLTHSLTIAYGQGTSEEDLVAFDKKDSAWEVYVVNKYMIYENLAAINELGYFNADLDDAEGEDASYFATIGFSYKF